jgi:hypothetical protein
MNKTEVESIRKELEEYQENSAQELEAFKLKQDLVNRQFENSKSIELLKNELATYEQNQADTIIKESMAADKLLQNWRDSVIFTLRAAISERIKYAELLSTTITKVTELFYSRSLQKSYNQKWNQLIVQLDKNKITLEQFRKEKPTKELMEVEKKAVETSTLVYAEFDKKEEVLQYTYDAMELSKKYKAGLPSIMQEREALLANKAPQPGNNYKNKYLKYKEKYLLLKTKLNEY